MARASLAELIGSAAAGQGGITLSNLHEVLGHMTPELPRNAVGHMRLHYALHQKFGPGYRSFPGVSDLLKQFDDEMDHEDRKRKLAQIHYEPEKGKK